MIRLWPFKPLIPYSEAYAWKTDVFQAKASEQRVSVRKVPLRTMSMTHLLSEYMANYASTLIRANLGADNFYVPDWTQFIPVSLSSGSNIPLGSDADQRIIGEKGVVYSAYNDYEIVDVDVDSNGTFIENLVGDFDNAYFMPVWEAVCLDGVSYSYIGRRNVKASVNFTAKSFEDFGESNYDQYRGHDIVPDCPVITASISASASQTMSVFGGDISDVEVIKRRSVPEINLTMNWRTTRFSDYTKLKKWIATRYGKLKGFWLSTSAGDFEPVAISGTTLTVFNDVLSRGPSFDIEILTKSGAKHRRQVTSVSAASESSNRLTVDMTIDSPLSLDVGDIERISNLYFCRFNSDRAEFNHMSRNIVDLQMPAVEVPLV